MEIFYTVLGTVAMYSIVHFIVIQFLVAWKDRTGYEKTVTIAGITFLALLMLGIIID